MQRHIARLKKSLGHHLEAVKGHYEAAIRHNKGNVELLVELAAYLFINRKYAEANMVFSDANDAAVNHQERRKIYHWWRDQNGKAPVFDGKVNSIQGAAARAIAIPEGFQASFWRTHPKLTDLKEGDQIKFQVGFNSKGPVAHIMF